MCSHHPEIQIARRHPNPRWPTASWTGFPSWWRTPSIAVSIPSLKVGKHDDDKFHNFTVALRNKYIRLYWSTLRYRCNEFGIPFHRKSSSVSSIDPRYSCCQNPTMCSLNILRFAVHTLLPPGRSAKVALSSRLTRTTAECASSVLKRFPRDIEGILLEVQGRLIVPVEVDGHRDGIRGTLLVVVVAEVPIVHAIRLGDNQLRTQFEIVAIQWIVSRPGYVAITLGGTICRYCPLGSHVDLTVLHRPGQNKVCYARSYAADDPVWIERMVWLTTLTPQTGE